MTDTNEPTNNPFQSETQTAIFNFLFALVDEYSKSMPPVEAVEKACDWITSLANDVRKKSQEHHRDLLEKQKLFGQS